MEPYWVDVALIAVLMLVNGAFAGSEIALISLREGQLRALERRATRRDRTLVRLARDPNRFLGTIQLGITLAGYLASATAAVTLAKPLMSSLSFLGDAANAVAIALITFILTAVNLVVGELAPKRLGMQYARQWSGLVASPLNILATVSRPLTWLLGKATDVVVRLLGGDPSIGREQLSPDELRELVVGHPGLTAEQRTIITGALEIHERALREVLVPRRAVITLRDDTPVEQARATLAESGHSRAPVVHFRELDDYCRRRRGTARGLRPAAPTPRAQPVGCGGRCGSQAGPLARCRTECPVWQAVPPNPSCPARSCEWPGSPGRVRETGSC